MADGTREYSLLGRDGEQAMATGLAGARRYQTDVPRKQLAALMQRRDGPAIRDTIILFTAMAALGTAGAWLFPSWLAVPRVEFSMFRRIAFKSDRMKPDASSQRRPPAAGTGSCQIVRLSSGAGCRGDRGGDAPPCANRQTADHHPAPG